MARMKQHWKSTFVDFLNRLRGSQNFRDSAGNSIYSIAEYVAQPISMLVAAPFLVHQLGLPQYGIWMLVSAILGSMGILSTGFGDATVRYVSAYRGQNDQIGVERTIRATLTINTVLATILASSICMGARFCVYHLFKIPPEFRESSVIAIRISALILIVRSIESVFVSALRAFERYGPAVKLNIFLRFIVVVSAVVLAALHRGIVDIMVATLAWSALIVALVAVAARREAGGFNAFPTVEREAIAEVFAFGCFSWVQALAGVVFSYADRFVVASMLGTEAVGIYVLCLQVTQPIHGLASAAFNFVFPHISSRHEAGEVQGPRRVFRLAQIGSVVLGLSLSLPLVLFANPLLRFWMGKQIAGDGHVVLALLAVAYALMAINIVPHYALLAFGRVRFTSGLNVASGILLVPLIAILIPKFGLEGAAVGRIFYSLLLTVPYLVISHRAVHGSSQITSVGLTQPMS